MKVFITALLVFAAFSVQAIAGEVTVQCARNAGSLCVEKTERAFAELGCNPSHQQTVCEDATTSASLDPAEIDQVKGKDFCTIHSDCNEPHYGNFGQVSCPGISVDLKSVDSDITLTTSVGLPRHYVTTLCK